MNTNWIERVMRLNARIVASEARLTAHVDTLLTHCVAIGVVNARQFLDASLLRYTYGMAHRDIIAAATHRMVWGGERLPDESKRVLRSPNVTLATFITSS